MEKQYRSNNNFILANHLPRIFNMMHILNMMVYGFVASQPAYFVSALSSLQKSIRLSPERQLRKKVLGRLRSLYYSALTVSVLIGLFINGSAISHQLSAFSFQLSAERQIVRYFQLYL